MYQVLARKYRPQSFADLIGQEHVRTTLGNAIAQARIAHGYIFAGQRGTGKTTVARILARCLNCVEGPTSEPCGKCASCQEVAAGNSVDVIEIDAASNRGINEMRELRESIKYHPSRDRHKVFIIDEAHQITSEAFNALLKTLEEPPEWVVFILCTTESHKIPTTIASRCQQFSFRSVDFAEIIARMQWICEQEKVEAEPEAFAVLAQSGEGSVRDSLSALDQAIACCGNKLESAEVRRLLGMFSLESLHEVTDALIRGDSRRMLEIVLELESNGRNLHHFSRELSRYFRNLLVTKVAGVGTRLVAVSEAEQKRLAEICAVFSEEDLTRYLQLALDLFRELQYSMQPRLHLEIGLLKLVHAGRLTSLEEALAQTGQGSAGSVPAKPAPSAPPATKAPLRAAPAQEPKRPKSRPARPPSPAAGVASNYPPPPPEPPPPVMDEMPDEELPPFDALPQTPAPVPAPAKNGVTPAPATNTPAPATNGGTPAPKAAPAAVAGSLPEGDWKRRLHSEAEGLGLTFIADAIEHADISEGKGELRLTASREFMLALRSSDLQKVIRKVAGRPIKVTITVGNASSAPSPVEARVEVDEEASQRALENPEVKRFQELFQGSNVRTVRNLKQ
jgi:DNA polymerase III subunit gamma/tau